MYTPFMKKLLCVAALASTTLAQSISIVAPTPGATFKAGEEIAVELKESATPSSQTLDEVSLVIGTAGSPFDGSHLGSVSEGEGFQGVFSAQWTDNEGNKYANFSIVAPNWFNGPGSLNVAHFYLLGAYGASKLEFASVAFTVTGSSG